MILAQIEQDKWQGIHEVTLNTIIDRVYNLSSPVCRKSLIVLHLLEENEINQVLGQNFGIWSPGLTQARYLHYQWWQLQIPWGRKNLKYFGYAANSEGKVLASCKLYNLGYQSKSRVYKAAGIGAVFVAEQDRGNAAGQNLLRELAMHCKSADYDFMILNSDIDPAYYERLGFRSFEPSAFRVEVDKQWLLKATDELKTLSPPLQQVKVKIRPVTLKDVEEMVRHHQRWLASQPYGMRRSDDYMEFKLGRELYLKEHSKLGWPQMDIISVNEAQANGGYALIEQAGKYLRVLEVIAPESVRVCLWLQILKVAELRGTKVIRGWSKAAPPVKGVEHLMRDWSFPMVLPLKDDICEQLLSWTELKPPCLLELDHF